ncbi:helix-turn-helix transcriptional regulator [Pseudocolwellia agarivorans]|uniref:helix-turn-helix transcriptional regulator n=1 Tax=Pseudocolwellia agarivorans TaxID=1911682 RepID=UPI000984BF5F|nr:AlpA family phage regulatory protein [Pseudocolwellia agarivorans]
MISTYQQNTNQSPRILRRNKVLEMTGFSKSTLYNRNHDGSFPPPINLGGRSVGFVQSECEATLQAMIAGLPKEEIQTLVKSLVEKRTLNLGVL